MEQEGTWLCPTPLHRARLLDMEAKLRWPRTVMYGSLGIAMAAGVPWIGAWTLGLLLLVVLTYRPLTRRIATSGRPEYLVAATVVNAQLVLGLGIALSGGPRSPAIPMLLLLLVTLPARFSSRGVHAGLAVTVVVLLASTVGVDPAGFADYPLFVFVGLASVVGLTAFADTLMRAEMEQRSDAVLDPLTGLLNRKALVPRFDEIVQQASLGGGSVCLVVCDLDRFKEINDAHGHDGGDRVLRETASVMRAQLRSFELVYRLGGEEFVVVLPGASPEEGRAIAERVRAAIEAARPCGIAVTVSMGVAGARGGEVAYEPLFAAADAALYEAKRAGRNRVVVAGRGGPATVAPPAGPGIARAA